MPDKLGEYKTRENKELSEDAATSPADPDSWKPSLTLAASDGAVIANMRRLWLLMVGIYVAREHDRKIQHYLTSLKNKRLGLVVAPTKLDVRKIVAAAARKVTAIGLPDTHI